MRVDAIRIRNYKGFIDSDQLQIGRNFTIVVGQNNVGKTALLEAFRMQRAGNKPYRSPENDQLPGPNSESRFDITFCIDWDDVQKLAARISPQLHIPLNDRLSKEGPIVLQNIYPNSPLAVTLAYAGGRDGMCETWPSHGQFLNEQDHRHSYSLDFNTHSRSWNLNGRTGNPETIPKIINQASAEGIFVFSAERLRIDSSPVAPGQQMSHDAVNLPTMLHDMMSNWHTWNAFNEHVCDIFPSIKRVNLPPSADGGGQVMISLDQFPPAFSAVSYGIRLKDAGTGVGQVLAILYVAMTREKNIIVIDEPNSFLHPGAAKKLCQILKRYDNQYIISTHAPDLISAIDPDVIHLVSWDGEQSVVTQMNKEDVADRMRILDDLGAKLSDIFGADRIIWVEGETEEKCFPLIAHQTDKSAVSGVAFVRVRNVGDLISRSPKAEMVWDVYKRLSEGPALFPPALAFSFDRENRSDQERRDLVKKSSGLVRFLPRREYENYLLHPAAIAAVVAGEFQRRELELPPETEAILNWFNESSTKFGQRTEAHWKDDQSWISECASSKLLHSLFKEYSIVYSKISHGRELTEWILKNDRVHFQELSEYVKSLTIGI